MSFIEVENLRKTYRVPEPGQSPLRYLFAPRMGVREALSGISFHVEEGEAVAYIGPNGSGKSTTMKCLTGVLIPDAGKVLVGGVVPWRERLSYTRNIGVLFSQKTLLFWDLSVYDALLLYKAVYSLPQAQFKRRIEEFEDVFEVRPLLHTQVRKLSFGERMRCELLAALIHEPNVLFLDEPTVGLDVVARDRLQRFLKHYQQEHGLTIMLTTHQVSDVEELCQRVIVIAKGRSVFQGSLSELKERFGPTRLVQVEYHRIVDPSRLESLSILASSFHVSKDDRVVRLEVHNDQLAETHRLLLEALEIRSLRIGERPLEKVLVEVFERGAT
ncbi:MAG: ABC transporter ATP-binding protein [Bacillota bacterium]